MYCQTSLDNLRKMRMNATVCVYSFDLFPSASDAYVHNKIYVNVKLLAGLRIF